MRKAEAETVLWRRLDTPGHDACRVVDRGDRWRLEGSAVFRGETGTAALVYEVDYDRDWWTREAVVSGWEGARHVDVRVTRNSGGVWALNGRVLKGLEECVDLDLGFTPATNLAQLRRIALPVGQAADVPVAWLDTPFNSLELLKQRYERRTAETYWYAAPRFDYAALLEVNAAGFIDRYPGLWTAGD